MLMGMLPKKRGREIGRRILEEHRVELRERLAKTADNIVFNEEK